MDNIQEQGEKLDSVRSSQKNDHQIAEQIIQL